MTQVTVHIPHEDVVQSFISQNSYKDWIEMYDKISEDYGNWDVDIKILTHLVDKVYNQFIAKYRDHNNLPDNLRPLVEQSINEEFKEKVEEYKDWKLEDVGSEVKLGARDFCAKVTNHVPTYDDVFEAYIQGYELADEKEKQTPNLSDISTEQLLEELKDRMV